MNAEHSNAAPSSTPSTSVEVRDVTKRFGGHVVLADVSLRVEPGEMLALLGPSGCGKTTLLRIIAGLEQPDRGEVLVGGQILSGRGQAVPPERRRVGMVFQDWALFPHMTVAANVGYGLPRAGRAARVQEALTMVGLEGLGKRMPATLSGGQQQRVALARALAPRPTVLLMDEPFSNLDASLRAQVRTEVRRLLHELQITTVFVTHDQEEAFVLGDQVAVMHGGVLVQQASPSELYADPATPWVATFVGEANLVPGQAGGTFAHTCLGEVPLREPRHGLVDVLVRPEAVAVEPGGAAHVTAVEFHGHDTLYRVRVDAGPELVARAPTGPRFGEGARVRLVFTGAPAPSYPAGSNGSGGAGPGDLGSVNAHATSTA